MSSLIDATGGQSSAVHPSSNISNIGKASTVLHSIRKYLKSDLCINKQHLLGTGVFAKCFLGQVGPNRVCIKIIKSAYSNCFFKEVEILSKLCHPNVAYLHGICIESRHKIVVLAFHGMYDSMSYSLHSVLISSNSSKPDISVAQWKVIVASIVAGLNYLHEKCGILHNDLKEDNIVLQQQEIEKINGVIIDFGKASTNDMEKDTHYQKKIENYINQDIHT